MKKYRTLYLIIVCFLAGGCGILDFGRDVKVTYVVNGNAQNVMINYSVGAEGVDQEKGVTLPWEKEVTVRKGREIYVLARSLQERETTLTSQIVKNGNIIESTTVEASFAVAVAKTKIR
jgi:hypothetical protein